MTNLTTIARQVSKCPVKGRKRQYPNELKSKICSASKIHGRAHVARKVGVTQSLIYRWAKKSSAQINSVPAKEKINDLVLQELPHSRCHPFEKEEGPIIRLVSPSGVSMEVNNTSRINLTELINVFMKGV